MFLGGFYEKYNNAEFNINNVGCDVTLFGWVSKKRNLGGLLFIDLRDRSGIIQLIVKPDKEFYDIASNLKNESVIKVSGIIKERENKNKNIPTGDIEVIVDSFTLLSEANDLPFEITDETTALEDTRLKYRYLDLRRNYLKEKLITRSNITLAIRNFLSMKVLLKLKHQFFVNLLLKEQEII